MTDDMHDVQGQASDPTRRADAIARLGGESRAKLVLSSWASEDFENGSWLPNLKLVPSVAQIALSALAAPDSDGAALRRLRKKMTDCWQDRIETKKRFDVNTPDRREAQAEANAFQIACFEIDGELAARQDTPCSSDSSDPAREPDGDDLDRRIDGAVERIVNGHAAMRIPADVGDVDIVLRDCQDALRRLRDERDALREELEEHIKARQECKHILVGESAVQAVERLAKERDEARNLLDLTLRNIPVGNLLTHTRESLPDRVDDLVKAHAQLGLVDDILIDEGMTFGDEESTANVLRRLLTLRAAKPAPTSVRSVILNRGETSQHLHVVTVRPDPSTGDLDVFVDGGEADPAGDGALRKAAIDLAQRLPPKIVHPKSPTLGPGYVVANFFERDLASVNEAIAALRAALAAQEPPADEAKELREKLARVEEDNKWLRTCNVSWKKTAEELNQQLAAAREERDKAQFSARQFCGAHVGQKFDRCPVCYGKDIRQQLAAAHAEAGKLAANELRSLKGELRTAAPWIKDPIDRRIAALESQAKPEAAAATPAEREGDAVLRQYLGDTDEIAKASELNNDENALRELCRRALRGEGR